MLVSLYCRKQHNLTRRKPPVQLASKSSREAIPATDCKALANDAEAYSACEPENINALLSLTNTGQFTSEPDNSSQPVTIEAAQSVREPEIPSHRQLVSGVNIGQVASEVETGTCVVDVEVHAVAQSACEPENFNAHEPGISAICAKVGHKSRKRKRDAENWKQNKRKRLRQSGAQYTTVRGLQHAARSMKPIDCSNCRFHCSSKFSGEERLHIHSVFWKMTDNDKRHFFARTTERTPKKRTRLGRATRTQKQRKKATSYKFYLMKGVEKVRICKQFYLKTLDVCQKRVINYHKTKDPSTGAPNPITQGKHTKKKLPQADVEAVKMHINSFPVVESHYCRSRTQKKYLESGLSIRKMYDMFCEQRQSKALQGGLEYQEPIKEHFYREVFRTQFNIDFHQPKKDRCDTCEAYKATAQPSTAENEKQAAHVASKLATKKERDADRSNKSPEHAVVCFDLQNVISLPRSNISSFFYRRKLSVYNLTAHFSSVTDKHGYCAIWSKDYQAEVEMTLPVAFSFFYRQFRKTIHRSQNDVVVRLHSAEQKLHYESGHITFFGTAEPS